MIVAKWNKNGDCISIRRHAIDTGIVMSFLLRNYVSEQTITASGLSIQQFDSVAMYSALIHDLGKCTTAFQSKRTNKVNISNGYVLNSPHALAGAAIQNQCFNVPETICDITAAHHGVLRKKGKEHNYKYQMMKYASNYGRNQYDQEWKNIFSLALEKSGIVEFPEVNIKAQILITGLLIMADWLSSNEEYFSLNELMDEKTRKESALEKLKRDIPRKWSPLYADIDGTMLSKRFGFQTPNSLQRISIDIAESTMNPGIMIVEATMGSGKTECALSVAEILSFHSRAGGIYFGLPTQATANGLMSRIADWTATVSQGENVSFRLAHGNALNNAAYKELSICDQDGLTISKWLAGKHRALLSDFVIGTVDQLLLSGLYQKFFMLLHLGMSGKIIIIDEVHSYDAYMSKYLEIVLSWLGVYGVPVILLSATLTNERRIRFVEAYTGRIIDDSNSSYPSITWADCDGIRSIPVHDKVRGLEVALKRIDIENVTDTVLKSIADGGCAGIIVNTVALAQALKDEICDKSSGEETVILLHSRYIPAHRDILEKKIIHAVGKNSRSEERNRIIIIGTQVLEQSLDIDFDVLYVQMCPMDLMLQRIGRLHRHDGHSSYRPENLKKPQCFVFEYNVRVYDEYILRRTREVLPERINIPVDIKPLIEEVYDLKKGSYGADKVNFERSINALETEAAQYGLRTADKWESFKDHGADIKSTESVRYKMNMLPVILVIRNGNGEYTTFEKEPISSNPTSDEKAMLSNERVSLYYSEQLSAELNTQINLPKWKDELYDPILVFDATGHAVIGNTRYSYDKENGLRSTPL